MLRNPIKKYVKIEEYEELKNSEEDIKKDNEYLKQMVTDMKAELNEVSKVKKDFEDQNEKLEVLYDLGYIDKNGDPIR